jgi:hypothetical protein
MKTCIETLLKPTVPCSLLLAPSPRSDPSSATLWQSSICSAMDTLRQGNKKKTEQGHNLHPKLNQFVLELHTCPILENCHPKIKRK